MYCDKKKQWVGMKVILKKFTGDTISLRARYVTQISCDFHKIYPKLNIILRTVIRNKTFVKV